jgi:hypothetical protein
VSPVIVGLVVFGVAFAGVLFGLWLRARLPQHYLDKESQDSIKLGIGLIATMTALVLGLITASTKSSFDNIDSTVTEAASQLLSLDRLLARYGSETSGIRHDLKLLAQARVDSVWGQTSNPVAAPALSRAEQITEAIRDLSPGNESQRALQAKALDLGESLLHSRWAAILGTKSTVPTAFLTVLVLWQTFIFMIFGLLAPRNSLVVLVLFVCALSVGSAMFLILEMQSPFSGLIRVSDQPLRTAIEHMER